MFWSGTWPKHVGFNVILLLKFLIVIVHLVGPWFFDIYEMHGEKNIKLIEVS
jgi:hypothetical protein